MVNLDELSYQVLLRSMLDEFHWNHSAQAWEIMISEESMLTYQRLGVWTN